MTDYKLEPKSIVDELAQFIRQVDGNHRMGAGTLADKICERFHVGAPAVQGEPVGRVKTVGGYPDESEHTVEWLCKYKDLKDGDLLYTTPQHGEKQPAPDVTALVEALEQCITSMLDSGYRADSVVIRAARAALAAHRKGAKL